MNNLLQELAISSLNISKKIKNLTVVYNRPHSNQDADLKITNEDTLDEVNQVKNVLQSSGINAKIFALDEKNIDKLLELKTDFIFNLCYGIGGIPDSEEEVSI